MRKPTFNEVSQLDNDLYQLALYTVTKGKMVLPKSMPEMIDLQDKIVGKFNYYKTQIQSGECTFNFIKWSVLGKYGPYPQPKSKNNDEWSYDDITSYIREEDESKHEDALHASSFNALLDAFESHLKRRGSNPFDMGGNDMRDVPPNLFGDEDIDIDPIDEE